MTYFDRFVTDASSNVEQPVAEKIKNLPFNEVNLFAGQ